MLKKTFPAVAFVATLFMASCNENPSDLRPDVKVSVDTVPPGQRNNTSNIDNGRKDQKAAPKEVYLNHDEHANEIKKEVEGVPASQQTTDAAQVENN